MFCGARHGNKRARALTESAKLAEELKEVTTAAEEENKIPPEAEINPSLSPVSVAATTTVVPLIYILLRAEGGALVHRCLPMDKVDSKLLISLEWIATKFGQRSGELAWDIFREPQWEELSKATSQARFGNALSEFGWGKIKLTANDRLFIIPDLDDE